AADAEARADVVQPLGSEGLVYLNLSGAAGGTSLAIVLPSERAVREDERGGVRFLPDRLHLISPKNGNPLHWRPRSAPTRMVPAQDGRPGTCGPVSRAGPTPAARVHRRRQGWP